MLNNKKKDIGIEWILTFQQTTENSKKESKKIDKVFDFAREPKKTVEHEGNDDTNNSAHDMVSNCLGKSCWNW